MHQKHTSKFLYTVEHRLPDWTYLILYLRIIKANHFVILVTRADGSPSAVATLNDMNNGIILSL